MTFKTTADSESGRLFSIGRARYLAPSSISDISLSWTQDFRLVTVFTFAQEDGLQVALDWVRVRVEEYTNDDDVFDKTFLTTVIFQGADKDHVIFTNEAREYLRQLGNEKVAFMSSVEVLPGPYALVGNKLRDVWKLIDDVNGTCMATLKPQSNPSDTFESFQMRSSDDQYPSFALRSRIKSRAAIKSPLAGLRIVVKDNIHLKGMKTSVGNRAFYETYPPRQESAGCIQKLIDQGVMIAGKTKMTSFANWEEPLEYIDYQAPWNPRADRYQSPGGSSSGSAAAIATYDWLDIAIGTDTWASVTRPALWCGCFGLRPTLGAVSPEGVVPYCQTWDTPGILACDLQKCRNFAAEWLEPDSLEKTPKPFSSIIWPTDFWKIIDSEQIEIARQFTRGIETNLGLVCHEISFEETWSRSPPAEAGGVSLPDFINESIGAQCYDAYHNLDDFRDKHWEMFNHAPYVSPPNKRMWSFAKTITKEDADMNFGKMEVYRRWFRDIILAGENSNAIIIMPIESMAPRYRDQPPSFRRPPQDGINALALAPVMRSPALAVPLAEIAYNSSVTEQEEKLPFAVTMISNPGKS